MTLEALQAAVADPATPAWLRRGLALWSRCGASVPLERCLRLPTSPRRFAIAQRNHWLRIARQHVASDAELQHVLLTQGWRLLEWARRDQPPANASPLMIALYNALETGQPPPTSLKQLQRILGHRSPDSASIPAR